MSAVAALPSVDDVLGLPALLGQVVPQEFEDLNGHMNIAHYFDLQSQAVGRVFPALGYSADSDRRFGPFTLEQHLRYHAEVLVGHEVSAHVRLAGRTDRVLHGMSFLVDRTARRLANTLEFVVGNVDLRERRLAPYSDDAAAVIDAELARRAGLGWEVPRLGPVGLRRSPV